MLIESGTGNGKKMGVDDENRGMVDCITKTAERHVNESHGDAYHALIDISPTANDDCIFYMINSDNDKELVVEGIYLQVNAAGEIYVQLGDAGTRNSATAITPANCNAGSGNAANGTFEQGADLDGGAATLTGGTEVSRYVFAAANNSQFFNFEQDIIIPENQTLTIWCSSSAVTVNGTVVMNYHE